MFRTTVFLLLIACAAPLCAGDLHEQFFPDDSERDVARDWHVKFKLWTQEQCKGVLEAWFPDENATPQRYLVDRVDNDSIFARRLIETGATNIDGKLERTPALEQQEFRWDQWLPKFMLVTYPVESNQDDKDLVAFATWLYEAKEPLLANRVLTVLHQRNDNLRPAIEDYIRDEEKLRDAELSIYRYWDNDFRVYREILASAKLAKKLEKDRAKDAESRFNALKQQYETPEDRSMILEQLGYELRKWREDFTGLEVVDDREKDFDRLLGAINADLDKLKVYQELVAKDKAADEVDWKTVTETLDKALELDPYNLLLISQGADAWFEYAHPHVWSAKKRVVSDRENDLPRAIELYTSRLERQPANVKVMYNLALCHHARGNKDDAKKLYREIMQLNTDPALTRQAKKNLDLD